MRRLGDEDHGENLVPCCGRDRPVHIESAPTRSTTNTVTDSHPFHAHTRCDGRGKVEGRWLLVARWQVKAIGDKAAMIVDEAKSESKSESGLKSESEAIC